MDRLWARLAPAFIALLPVLALAQEKRSFSERFLYGGEVTANASPEDPGYFNQTEYLRNGLRLLRLNLALEFQATDTFSVLAEIRSDNLDVPEPYGLYLRVRPWAEHHLDVQLGRIPPVFGAFARRRYGFDNPLIGYPLAYQYPSTVRADAAPRELDDVLRQRGRGARVRYPLGDPTPMSGLPLANPLRWDTGVSVKLGDDPLELAVSWTQGTISNPRVDDDNSGKQLAGRLAWRPSFGWVVGASAARGEYVSGGLDLPEGGDQISFGVDSEYSAGYLVLRAEAVWSRWEMPTLDVGSLGALGWTAEARYKLWPGLYVAARFDRLTHERVEGSPWDAAVYRIETGLGYYVYRHLLLKASFQYNDRKGGPMTANGIPALQILWWF